jgi:cytoskeletal protein CcmA (bactofilin family)
MSLSGKNVSIEAFKSIYLSSAKTLVNSELYVNGQSTINNNLNVNGQTNLKGNLIINGTDLYNIVKSTASDSLSSGNVLNLGTGPTIQSINIGNSGAGVATINIGGLNDVINIIGNLNYIQSTNLEVDDKNIILNRGAQGSSTSFLGGIYLRDNDINDASYIRVANDGNSWELKLPTHSNVIKLKNQNFSHGLVLCDNSQNVTSSNVVPYDLSFNSNIIISSNLSVSGNVAVSKNATVSGIATLAHASITGNLDLAGNANVSGNVVLSKNATVSGTASLAHASITGNLDLAGNANVSGNLVLSKNATVSGTASLAHASITGNLDLAGNANVSGNLVLSQNATVSGTATLAHASITGNLDLAGNANVSGNVVLSKNATVSGTTTLAHASVSGNLDVSGNAHVVKELNVSGNASISHSLSVSGLANLKGKYVNNTHITNLINADFVSDALSYINGYFLQTEALASDSSFTVPAVVDVISKIKDVSVGASFTFTINNKGGVNKRIIHGNTGVVITNLFSPNIDTDKCKEFLYVITNTTASSEQAVILEKHV